MKKLPLRTILIIFLIASGTTVMYSLPYLKSTFYDPMRLALGLDHQQLGNLLSIYGLLSTVLYFFGGFIADKFSAKKLMAGSLISTGLLGFYFSTFPPYPILIAIFAAWGVTTILTFWAASMKVIRMLGDDEIQGKLFGFNEGLSGIAGVVVSFIGLYFFQYFSDITLGFRSIVWLYSGLSIFCGILVFFVVQEKNVIGEKSPSLTDLLSALKMTKAWLIGLIIFCTYIIFSSLTYLNPYLKDGFAVSLTIISAIAILRTYAIKIGASPLAGILSDKVGSSLKILSYGFVIIALCEVIYLLLPRTSDFVILAVINMIVLSIFLFGFRGIYFATVAESKIPVEKTGAVIGLASFIGFSPDAFFYTIVGGWIDQGPEGYTYLFSVCLVCAIIGFLASRILYKLNQKETLS